MKNQIWLVVKILVLVVIVAWISVIVLDYFNAKNNKQMKFCMSESLYIYENGEKTKTLDGKDFNEDKYKDYSYTYECSGLGYKVYRYNRTDTNPPFKAIEFGPFFIKERQSLNEK